MAQAYATRHPDHPAKLILANTGAKVEYDKIFATFERIGGQQARAIAETYFFDINLENRAKYLEVCLPLYRARPTVNPTVTRSILKSEIPLMFNGPDNEQGRLDYRKELARVACPTLVMGGDRDPIMPIEFAETIAASLPARFVRFERFAGCGHVPWLDAQERAIKVMREFILAA